MKTFIKKILVFLAILFSTATVISIPNATSVYADPTSPSSNSNCRYLLGMPSWDCNVDLDNIDNTDNLTSAIWQIVFNILTDISVIAVYLVIGYVIYGGYLYMFSSGDPVKAATGKKTLTRAFIGLAIVMSANCAPAMFR